MMTVPAVEQTSIGAQPFAAPGVAPMRNDAPGQMEQFGQQLQQTGGLAMREAQTIGDRLTDQIDEAHVKSAETGFLGKMQGILHDPDTGYLNQRGRNAVDQYQPAQQSLAKAGGDTLATLSNPIQQHMFNQVMQQHLLSAGQQMAEHNHSQSVAWSAGESKARADSMQTLALNAMGSRYQADADGNTTGDFANYTHQMETETYKAASLAGLGPDDAQTQKMLQEQWSQLNHAVIVKLLSNDDAQGAKKWYDDQLAKGNIDLRTSEQLGGAVKTEYDQQDVQNKALELRDKAISGGKLPFSPVLPVAGSSINVTDGLGTARADGRKHDGIDIAVPMGTKVMSPEAGKVSKVWTDDKFGGGLSVEIQYPNGYTTGFAHLSAANVKVGDDVPQGAQVGLSGKTGNATGPVLHYMMKDADGKYIDPRQAGQPKPDAAGFADPKALQSALDDLSKRDDLDPHKKKLIAGQLEALHAHEYSIKNQTETQNFKQASDAFYNGGMNWQSIPKDTWVSLNGEQRQHFRDTQTEETLKQFHQGQEFKEMNEVDSRVYFDQNPDMLTPENVGQARPRLSNSTYLSLMKTATDLKENPKGVQEAQNVNERVTYFASHNGVNVHPKTDTDKQTLIDLKGRIQQNIDQIKSQNNGKATAEQVDKSIQQELIRHTVQTPRSPWNPLGLISPTTQTQRYGFQLPRGATHVAKMSDGKLHYTDAGGTQDLGVAQ